MVAGQSGRRRRAGLLPPAREGQPGEIRHHQAAVYAVVAGRATAAFAEAELAPERVLRGWGMESGPKWIPLGCPAEPGGGLRRLALPLDSKHLFINSPYAGEPDTGIREGRAALPAGDQRRGTAGRLAGDAQRHPQAQGDGEDAGGHQAPHQPAPPGGTEGRAQQRAGPVPHSPRAAPGRWCWSGRRTPARAVCWRRPPMPRSRWPITRSPRSCRSRACGTRTTCRSSWWTRRRSRRARADRFDGHDSQRRCGLRGGRGGRGGARPGRRWCWACLSARGLALRSVPRNELPAGGCEASGRG